MTLKTDKYRMVDKKPKLLAPKGATVNLIAWHDKTAIVEYNGERFSVNEDDLIIEKEAT